MKNNIVSSRVWRREEFVLDGNIGYIDIKIYDATFFLSAWNLSSFSEDERELSVFQNKVLRKMSEPTKLK
jgi:hypothetical protein